jgi:hypothetical protein
VLIVPYPDTATIMLDQPKITETYDVRDLAQVTQFEQIFVGK